MSHHEPAQSCSGSPSVALAAETRAFPSLTPMILQLQTRADEFGDFRTSPVWWHWGTTNWVADRNFFWFSEQYNRQLWISAWKKTFRTMGARCDSKMHEWKCLSQKQVKTTFKRVHVIKIRRILFIYVYIYIYIVCLFIYLLILYIIIYIYLSSKLSLEHLLLASMVWHLCFSKKPYAQRPQAKKPTISSVYYPC